MAELALPSLLLFFFFFSTVIILNVGAQTTPSTDPVELAALNAIFAKWGISAANSSTSWNTSGEPCAGLTVTGANNYDNEDFNPAIICDCSYNKGSTCRITRLKARRLNITGTIPGELKQLTKLENLQIAENYLSGPLPAFIGNFTEMEYLSFGKNMLSGPIPKELGNLQKLISLGMGINNFSGSLPEELGNLTNLEQLYIDSIGVVGMIPSTFGKLKKLYKLMASDNDFGGNVPEFIGNLTDLQNLKLQGNNFHGPIPSTLANLVKLDELRLGNLLGGTSSLTFVKNMTLLSRLVLRDSRISGFIPPEISELNNLVFLDLSFNNLTGKLPPSLFNMLSLKTLYLGNNRISGNLPKEKSANLVTIDLSYNEFSGTVPGWAADVNLNLNLVANNFDVTSSNNVQQSGWECLQRDFPCYRGSPYSYSFAINCGGDELEVSDQTIYESAIYESDNKDLSNTSYYVTDVRRWAVSSVGTFLDAPNPKYTENIESDFENTLDSRLFQSARISPSSLRYYGLALENGNYTVKLQFAETAFPNRQTYLSLGRRVFDIYIQGNLVAKDFDIRKQAGGSSFKAVQKKYTASVTDNYIEIHFFWAGKGTCCLPTRGYYGSSISAISISPNFRPTVSNKPPKNSFTRKKLIALAAGISVALAAMLIVCAICIYRRKKPHMINDEELRGLPVMPKSYRLVDLKTATGDFNLINKLGEGGFGPVFKGTLSDGTLVAVKLLSLESIHGKRQFVSEVATISALKHRNLVKLLGCCYEEEKRLLVYEFLENRSLDQALFGKRKMNLDWPTRFNICLGTARGLAYLHEESRVRIVHRDIKASNILLGANLNPKISDFGLAKLYEDHMTHMSTKVAGTIGYLAPEYAMRGHLTEKADVYAFGIVALEIVAGRPCIDTCFVDEKIYLLEWAWNQHESKNDLNILDSELKSFNKDEVMRVIGVALLCTQANPMSRPSMSQVISMLVGDVSIGEMTSKPYLTDWLSDGFSSQLNSTIDSSCNSGFGYSSPSPCQPILNSKDGL